MIYQRQPWELCIVETYLGDLGQNSFQTLIQTKFAEEVNINILNKYTQNIFQ